MRGDWARLDQRRLLDRIHPAKGAINCRIMPDKLKCTIFVIINSKHGVLAIQGPILKRKKRAEGGVDDLSRPPQTSALERAWRR
jgi:hypothetical protein